MKITSDVIDAVLGQLDRSHEEDPQRKAEFYAFLKDVSTAMDTSHQSNIWCAVIGFYSQTMDKPNLAYTLFKTGFAHGIVVGESMRVAEELERLVG